MSNPTQNNGLIHLASLLDEGRILPAMAARERWPAIVELVDHLDHLGHLADCGRDNVLQALQKRENLVSTAVGSGVAIPHAFSERTENVIAVMGRSLEGIEFEAPDHGPAHLVILFVAPRQHYDLHLKTLAAIARILHNDDVKSRLMHASSAMEMLLLLQRRSSRAA